MCASIDDWLNAPCTGTSRTFEWSDSFAANTSMLVEYRRPENGWLVVDRDVTFKVYVEETESALTGLADPLLNNPWEYAGWLQNWTVGYATSAPFWRRYWTYAGDYGDLRFNVDWAFTPNSERALLTLLAHTTREVVKWTLRSAFRQFKTLESSPGAISDEAALGKYSYRVAFYMDANYNSASTAGPDGGSPEYLRSISFTCTPYEKRPCLEQYINLSASYPWMSQTISSMMVRNARVILYNAFGAAMEQNMNTPSLGSFNDQVTAVRIIPAYPERLLEVTPAMTAGNSHSCRLRGDGLINCWGYNAVGIATPPEGSFAQISAGASHSCAIRPNRSVVCWGTDYFGKSSPPALSFVEVSAGSGFTCGVKSDETAVCWGDDRWGLTAAPQGVFFKQISSGTYHSCGISSQTSTLYCWGDYTGALTPPAGTFKKVSVGDNFACGIRTNGTIACWEPASGTPSTGPIFTNIPTGLFVEIDAGIYHACAINTERLPEMLGHGQLWPKQYRPWGYFSASGGRVLPFLRPGIR